MKKQITEDQRSRKNAGARERYSAERSAGIPRFTPEQRKAALESQKRSTDKHAEAIKIRRSNAYQSSKKSILESRKHYYAANKETVLASRAAYRSENREKVIEGNAAWRAANKDKIYELNRNYRAAKRGAKGSHSRGDISILYAHQRGLCAACCCKVTKTGENSFHVDHIVALSRGGSNYPDNLQLLCRFCNLSKGPKDHFEWAAENGKLL